ncbi:MAG: hypothetical protein ACRDK4_03495 [Solirubrobacteraceae bacterium]
MTPEDKDGSENAQEGGVAVLDPVGELAEYRLLLLTPEVLRDPDVFDLDEFEVVVPVPVPVPAPVEDELAEATPQERERLRELVKAAGRLEALTGWTREQLLDNIGCEDRDPKVVVKDAEHTERCTRFLNTLLGAAERVDSARSCQAVVRRCARLSKDLDVESFEQLLEEGEPSPLDYISLGELSTAMRLARVAAGKEHDAAFFGPSPYDSAPVVHLSAPRVDLYVQGKRDVLGERVHTSMMAHIENCSACKDAVALRRSLTVPG